MMISPPSANTSPRFWRSKPGIALGMLLVIVLFYLAREHYGHMLGLLPYMILLLCPLMHFSGTTTVVTVNTAKPQTQP